ncbi:MAG: FAD-binding oxidoreductase [Acidimicrobiales bacterium]
MSRLVPPLEVEAELGQATEHLVAPRVPVADAVVERLRSVCDVDVGERARAEVGRDWWPITIGWATRGEVPARPAVVARPSEPAQVGALLAICHEARVPLTPTAGRSGVCGASVPAFGGVSLDLCGIAGVVECDTTSLQATVLPGTFGPDLEEALRSQGTTLGHWPQSMDISTVGGWLACRGAGQYSTRYGKIEDMVVGLEVALADGSTIRTGTAAPRSAVGPDLTALFVGSEGTLGVITSARLRLHRVPATEARRAFWFGAFEDGLEACRQVLQRGATPAVLRLYDEVESARNFSVEDRCVVVVLDEADPSLLGATMSIVEEEYAAAGASVMDDAVVETWLAHRNDVSALGPLYKGGIVVDTIEISARWSELGPIYRAAVAALQATEGTLVASAHQSHSYTDGACLYFTFAGRMSESDGLSEAEWAQRYYVSAWDSVMDVVISHGGAVSHHHGIGLNRARFMRRALGGGFEVLAAVKDALDPRGILNPGKLGLRSPFGEIAWP